MSQAQLRDWWRWADSFVADLRERGVQASSIERELALAERDWRSTGGAPERALGDPISRANGLDLSEADYVAAGLWLLPLFLVLLGLLVHDVADFWRQRAGWTALDVAFVLLALVAIVRRRWFAEQRRLRAAPPQHPESRWPSWVRTLAAWTLILGGLVAIGAVLWWLVPYVERLPVLFSTPVTATMLVGSVLSVSGLLLAVWVGRQTWVRPFGLNSVVQLAPVGLILGFLTYVDLRETVEQIMTYGWFGE